MAKNKISDLRDHMFMCLEDLNNPDLTKEELAIAIAKAESIASIGKVIVESAKVENDFLRMQLKAEEKTKTSLFLHEGGANGTS